MLKSHKKTIFETLGRHPIHPFPARMAPGIALDAIGDGKAPLRVLDPMMGSGTVLAVARFRGHRGIGVDMDPLAVLLSKVWTTTIDATEVEDKAAEVLDRAQAIFRSLKAGQAYPIHADEATRRFVRFWFDQHARRQLASLSMAINRVQAQDVRNALWCGFSRLIITKSAGASLAMDLSHSRPHKAFERAPVKPFAKFLSAVSTVVENSPQRSLGRVGPATVTTLGDARRLPIAGRSIDLVLTSPPYLNAIDYMRCSKFSLVWMGHQTEELRDVRSASIGCESASSEALDDCNVRAIIKDLKLSPRLGQRDEALLARYVFDMNKALRQVARVLVSGGRAVYVVGESTVRGTYIRNSEVVVSAATLAGLTLVERRSRQLPPNRRYLPPPSGKSAQFLNGRMRREIVLAFRKQRAA